MDRDQEEDFLDGDKMGGLQLYRKRGEKIIISVGDKRLTMTITETTANSVKLLFSGDKEIVVKREEIADVHAED